MLRFSEAVDFAIALRFMFRSNLNSILRCVVAMRKGSTDKKKRAANRAAQMTLDFKGEPERIALSVRDSLRVIELLKHPLPPNARMLAAARDLPPRSQTRG